MDVKVTAEGQTISNFINNTQGIVLMRQMLLYLIRLIIVKDFLEGKWMI